MRMRARWGVMVGVVVAVIGGREGSWAGDAPTPAGSEAETAAEAKADAAEARGDGGADGEAASEDLPPGVVARIDGRDVTVREYADYLLASIGTAKLGEYLDRLLLAAEAERRQVIVTPEEVESMVEESIDRTINGLYRGDRKLYLESLERQGVTLEEREGWLRQKLFYDTLLDRLVIDRRKVSDSDVRTEFERAYGEGGVQRRVRHILVATGPRIGPDGERLPPRSEEAAKKRAEAILRQLRSGADFVTLVRKYSDDTFTRPRDGEIAGSVDGVFGKEFDAAVEKLSESRPLSDVVASPRGYHIVQYLGTRRTEFEDVRDEIEKELRLRAPTTEERLALLETLRQDATIVR